MHKEHYEDYLTHPHHESFYPLGLVWLQVMENQTPNDEKVKGNLSTRATEKSRSIRLQSWLDPA